jgi:AraC-like DNA-binding protein
MGDEGTVGILNPQAGLATWDLLRTAPSAALQPFVALYWIVHWDRTEQPQYTQQVLPHPCMHLAIEPERAAVHGVGSARFVAELRGRGRVIGVKFTPAGFSAFAEPPVQRFTDRVTPIEHVFGGAGAALAEAVRAEPDVPRALALVEAFLIAREPVLEEAAARANYLVERAQSDRGIMTAEDLARAGAMSVRSLHRSFTRYVGVGPKWVIRRARVHEAAERVQQRAKIDWAALAQELGYHDQAHFIRDFKAQIGLTPAAYAAHCAATRG